MYDDHDCDHDHSNVAVAREQAESLVESFRSYLDHLRTHDDAALFAPAIAGLTQAVDHVKVLMDEWDGMDDATLIGALIDAGNAAGAVTAAAESFQQFIAMAGSSFGAHAAHTGQAAAVAQAMIDRGVGIPPGIARAMNEVPGVDALERFANGGGYL